MQLNQMIHYYDEGLVTERELFSMMTEEYDEAWLVDVLSGRTDIITMIKDFQKERSLCTVFKRTF